MCLNPIALPRKTGSEYVFVPCGKCAECLKTLGNEFAVRCVREAQNAKSFHFVTLTYRDDTLPIYRRIIPVDDETGEWLRWFQEEDLLKGRELKIERDNFLKEADYEKVFTESGKCIRRFLPISKVVGDSIVTVFHSVNNRDFQRVLKRFRKNEDYPEFSYACVPEYSSHTYRPHYHVLFFNLTDEQVGRFCDDWRKNYGFVDIRRVAPDMTDISKVAKYVGQYTYKGKYDLKYIQQGFCKKPHRMMSQDFGIGNREEFERLLKYYKCEDVYGEYDPDDKEFVDAHKDTIVDDILQRRHYNINGYTYPLPEYIKRKIFFRYEEKRDYRTWKKIGVYKATYLQNVVSDAIFEHLRRDSDAERERMQRHAESLGSDFQQIWSVELDTQKSEKVVAEANFINKINKNQKL